MAVRLFCIAWPGRLYIDAGRLAAGLSSHHHVLAALFVNVIFLFVYK